MMRFARAALLSATIVACGESESPPRGTTTPSGDAPATGVADKRVSNDNAGPAPESTRLPQPTDLFSKTFGDSKSQAVVFVHGGPGADSVDFESTAAQALADEGFFVVTYDQRGCGRSPKGTIADYRYSKAGDDLDDLVFTLKLDKPVLLAHSFGGSVALHYVDAHPNRAKGVILAGSPINFPAMYRTILETSQDVYMSHFMKPKADEVAELEAKMFPNGLMGPFTYSTDDIVATTKEMTQPGIALPRFPSPTALKLRLTGDFNGELGEGYQQNDKVGYTDFTPLLKQHADSVWAAYGAEDHIFDDAQLSSIESTVGASHFAKIPDASHFSYVDNTSGFVSVVAKHLDAMK